MLRDELGVPVAWPGCVLMMSAPFVMSQTKPTIGSAAVDCSGRPIGRHGTVIAS